MLKENRVKKAPLASISIGNIFKKLAENYIIPMGFIIEQENKNHIILVRNEEGFEFCIYFKTNFEEVDNTYTSFQRYQLYYQFERDTGKIDTAEMWVGGNENELTNDVLDMLNILDKNLDFKLNESIQRLNEKKLWGSLESQNKKALKSIEDQLKTFTKALEKVKGKGEEILLDADLSEEDLDHPIKSFKADALKKIAKAQAAIELENALKSTKTQLEKARGILSDPKYKEICKEIDDNTGLFGGSKGKLKAKGDDGEEIDVTSKTVGKVVKEETLNEFNFKKKEKKDVTEDLEYFKKKTKELSKYVEAAATVMELLEKDPDMKKVTDEFGMKFDGVLGKMAAVGMVLKLAGGLGVPGVGLIGTALASGSVITRNGKGILKTLKGNGSFAQKLWDIAPKVAGMYFAASGLKNTMGNISNIVDTEEVPDEELDDEEDLDDEDSEELDDGDEEDLGDDSEDDEIPEEGPEEDEEEYVKDIQGQADAEPGDIFKREDGTKIKLTAADIKWAKKILKQEPDMGEATAEDTEDMSDPNPVLDSENVVDDSEDEIPEDDDEIPEDNSEDDEIPEEDDSAERDEAVQEIEEKNQEIEEQQKEIIEDTEETGNEIVETDGDTKEKANALEMLVKEKGKEQTDSEDKYWDKVAEKARDKEEAYIYLAHKPTENEGSLHYDGKNWHGFYNPKDGTVGVSIVDNKGVNHYFLNGKEVSGNELVKKAKYLNGSGIGVSLFRAGDKNGAFKLEILHPEKDINYDNYNFRKPLLVDSEGAVLTRSKEIEKSLMQRFNPKTGESKILSEPIV